MISVMIEQIDQLEFLHLYIDLNGHLTGSIIYNYSCNYYYCLPIRVLVHRFSANKVDFINGRISVDLVHMNMRKSCS